MNALLLSLILSTATSTSTVETGHEETGFLLVLVDVDGAVVRVDDNRVGLAPIPMLNVSVGEHRVVVELSGYGRYETTVKVTKGGITRVQAVVSPRALPKLSPAERLGIRTDGRVHAGPLITRPWFIGVAAGVAAVVVAIGLVIASGGDFVPNGELGNSSTDTWRKL